MTVGEVRALLAGLPDSQESASFAINDPKFVVLVDSLGNSQRIVSETKRSVMVIFDLPIGS